jgi:hypothetical protein
VGRSAMEMAALETPRRWPRLGGWKFGEVDPLSDLVGLVLMTAIELPSRRRPPTNSLPPRLWPWPVGRAGDGNSLFGEYGEVGGLRNRGLLGAGGRDAPGLKLKAGRATLAPLRGLSGFGGREPRGLSCCSWTDMGRRPEARGCTEGVDGESSLAGKTKCGFGGGAWES